MKTNPGRVIAGDCLDLMGQHGPYDMLVCDPPYGDTSLSWDRRTEGWIRVASAALKPSGSIWVFGSMRMFLSSGPAFAAAGLRYAQDVVWEKHNGSGFQSDRFKRVHEHAVQFYKDGTKWADIYNNVQKTEDATARTVRRKIRPPHMGDTKQSVYVSEDGGPRLMRSVLKIKSCHGVAIHPTEKPVELLRILIETSCPPGGIVCDPFAGSGSAGEACRIVGRRYVGFEIGEEMAGKANDRLASLLL